MSRVVATHSRKARARRCWSAISSFAADLGIDVWEAIDVASTKPFGYHARTGGEAQVSST